MNSSTDCKKRCCNCAYTVAIIGCFLIVAWLVGVMRHYTKPAPLSEDRGAVRRKNLADLRGAAQQIYNNPDYVWENQAKGVVRIPVERAMEMAVQLWKDPAEARKNLIARTEKATAVPPPVSFE